ATFRETVDRCCSLFMSANDQNIDLRHTLFPLPEQADQARERLSRTQFTQPALFIIEYALALLLQEWGIEPVAMLGHSIGEYVAATLAGVFSLEDALFLVMRRGELVQKALPGAMLSVALPEDRVLPYLNEQISLAAINGPELTVVAGLPDAIDSLQRLLTEQKIACHKLHTSHAFHSWMMDELVEQFAAEVRRRPLHTPRVPILSNLTGTWLQDSEALDAHYWARHLRAPVRFQDGVQKLLALPDPLMIEVGPGQTLTRIIRRQVSQDRPGLIVSTLPEHDEAQDAATSLLTALARLWIAGMPVAWQRRYQSEHRQRVSLPTYPFARERHWLQHEEHKPEIAPVPNETGLTTVLWQQAIPPAGADTPSEQEQHVLVLLDDPFPGGCDPVSRFRAEHYTVTCVQAGDHFQSLDDETYQINPAKPEDYVLLLQHIPHVHKVFHMWNVGPEEERYPSADLIPYERAFYSVLYLLQAITQTQELVDLQLYLVTTQLFSITGTEHIQPHKALLSGPAQVIGLEHPEVSCRLVDISYPRNSEQAHLLLDQLVTELRNTSSESPVAYRGIHYWKQTFQPLTQRHLEARNTLPSFRTGGTYLLTGGLGGIGSGLAEQLAHHYQAKLVLLARTALPERTAWADWLGTHEEQGRISQILRKLIHLEELGSEILVLAVDITDPLQTQHAVTQAKARFGKIDGVLHLAGVPGAGLAQMKTLELAAPVLAPKVQGTLNLARALRDTPLDFWLLFSSFTVITGGIGQVDYIAANAFLDAFAASYQQTTGIRTIAINWDAWQWDSWMSSTMHILPELQRRIQQLRSEKGITFAQGLAFLEQIVHLPFSQVMVSTQDASAARLQHQQLARTFWEQ
ncbi:MAG TPA: SDR family NAD(P)-dependent oxidoreductase, partial [Ktedonobacteraceae bacterium]|nr:SDR family NAD(P)-dependent oxidoreductase [Ktedonobacteraceae bacterium]